MKWGWSTIDFKNTFQSKKNTLVTITCIVWFFTKLFSYNLWHADRLFPVVPPFAFLENIPNIIHLGLFWVVLMGLLLIPFHHNNKYLLFFILLVEFCSCMLDQNRWQPYEFQFFLTLLFALFYRNNPKQFINYFSFLLVVIYIQSGLHKLSGAFLYSVWEHMILQRFFGFSREIIQNIYLHYSGLLVGLFEFGAGVGLLVFKRKRRVALLLIGMHFFILLVLSPIGINHNSIVWPWNAAMIVFLYVLFCTKKQMHIQWRGLVSGYNKIHFVYLGIMPFFCFLGLYDNYLSFNVYSGTAMRLEICIENPEKASEYKPYFQKKGALCKSEASIRLNNWSLKEMNIIAYPEERVFRSIIKKFKERNPDVQAHYFISHYPFQAEQCKQYE
jgi:hypothetical protein